MLRDVNVINLEVELNLIDWCYVVWACEAFSFENWCLLYMLRYPVHYLNWRIGIHAFVHIVWIWLIILLLLKLESCIVLWTLWFYHILIVILNPHTFLFKQLLQILIMWTYRKLELRYFWNIVLYIYHVLLQLPTWLY